jgi:hypothetical protein
MPRSHCNNESASSRKRPISCHSTGAENEFYRLSSQHDLSRSAQFAESRKDLADRFLKPAIRIEIGVGLATPDQADGNADASLAAACIGADSVNHGRPNDAGFQLADAVLQAQREVV